MRYGKAPRAIVTLQKAVKRVDHRGGTIQWVDFITDIVASLPNTNQSEVTTRDGQESQSNYSLVMRALPGVDVDYANTRFKVQPNGPTLILQGQVMTSEQNPGWWVFKCKEMLKSRGEVTTGS